MQTFVTTCSIILFAAVMLTSCSTTPIDLSAYQGCDVAPNKWRQIAVPSNREALLNLPEEFGKKPVRNLFGSADDLREVWFESSSGNDLQACLYHPRYGCSFGGDLRKVTFTKRETSWEAGPTTVTVCSH